MKFLYNYVIISLLIAKYCLSQDPSVQNNKDGGKETDASALDEIIRFNNISLQAEYAVERNRSTPNKFLLHEDVQNLKNLSEGDLLLDKKDKELLNENMNAEKTNENLSSKRSMIPYARKLWISRTVPYIINHPGTIRHSATGVRQEIVKALNTLSSKSCIKFRERRSGDQNWLEFMRGSGCYSGIGRKYWDVKATEISLGDYCVHKSIIIHEVLHALGFFHEQSRPDRDSFVNIYWSNMLSNMASNFKRHVSYDATIQDTPYDYKSLMHYGKTSFTMNGKVTIEAKFDKNQPLGGTVMTYWDEAELNKMYQCKKDDASVQKDAWSTWGEWTPDCFTYRNQGCYQIRQRFCMSTDFSRCPKADEFGVEDHLEECPAANCTIELLQPHWGNWAPYNKCTRTCGDGIQTRSRVCNNPPPVYGMQCKGHKTQTSLCRMRKCKPVELDTDFESKSFGAWRNDYQEKMNWKLTYGPTPNAESGPDYDHTTGGGRYAYLSATDPFYHNAQVGRLISNKIPANKDGRCVTFYYQLNGKNINYLDWYIKIVDKQEFYTYWQRNGHQGNYWQRGAFSIPPRGDPYEIIVEGKLGLAPHSDIAIDDIQVDKGTCIAGSEGCFDYYKYCEYWRLHGECYKNYRWMLRSCCATCSGMSDCQNKYNEQQCQNWASVNECKKNPMWMWQNCCKACKSCTDQHVYCSYWAGVGECEKSEWMKRHCKNSCGICKA